MGIPYRRPSRFPLPRRTPPAPITGCTDQDCALARQFAHAVYRALFVDDQDISAPETVIEIAAKLGVDRSNLENALQSPEIKARLKDESG
jgi:2-hydroxychromene-2-carboxylate isomerase